MVLQNFDYSRLSIESLHSGHLPRFASFTCGDSDLASILKGDSLRLHEEHFSFTGITIADEQAAALCPEQRAAFTDHAVFSKR